MDFLKFLKNSVDSLSIIGDFSTGNLCVLPGFLLCFGFIEALSRIQKRNKKITLTLLLGRYYQISGQ